VDKKLEEKLKGVIILSHTPLNRDYSLNEEGIKKYVEWCINAGANGIWMDGIASDCQYLDEDVRKREHEVFMEAARGKLVMGCGIFGYNPNQCIRYAKHAENLGYDYAFFNAPNKAAVNDDIYEYFKMVHDNTRIPIGIYNSSLGPYLSPETVARIAGLERVVCMKCVKVESTYMFELFQLGIFDKIKVFVSRTIALSLALGAAGVITPVSRFKTISDIYYTYMKGDIIGAIKKEATEPNGGPGSISKGNTAKPSNALNKAVISQMIGVDMGPNMAGKPPTEADMVTVREMIRTGRVME
jgi:dihydrodipicolinate synthase/N-acetylneuraminate lyase